MKNLPKKPAVGGMPLNATEDEVVVHDNDHHVEVQAFPSLECEFPQEGWRFQTIRDFRQSTPEEAA